MKWHIALQCLGLSLLTVLLAAGPATRPGTAAEAPELPPLQRNLLLQLADTEANIQAINKALVLTGYRVGVEYSHIDSQLKGSEFMDRKGGGPVRWDAFYGKTAKDYAKTGIGDHRPQQFAFIYKANTDQVNRAKDQIAALAKDQAALLDRRQKHEADQSRLWATLSWQEVKDREIDLKPMCRFALKPAGADASVLRPLILFLRTSDRVAVEGIDSVEANQQGTFQAGSQRMEAAFGALQRSMVDALESAGLKPEHKKGALALKALCKDLAEQAKVVAVNFDNALDRDKAKQDSSKLEFRGELQSSLSKFATLAGRLDDELSTTAKEWDVDFDRNTPTPDALPGAAVAKHDQRPGAPNDGGGKWVSLFNGKDLNGWFVDGGDEKNFRVEDGVLVLAGGSWEARSYLLSDRDYGNFRLRLEYKVDGNTRGAIALRGIPGEKLHDNRLLHLEHPQVKLVTPGMKKEREPTGTMHWLRDVMFVHPDRPATEEPAGSWNRIEIELRGHTLKTFVNDQQICETTLAEGVLMHDGAVPGLNRVKGRVGFEKQNGTIRFRNVEIMELP